ncbi:MAG: hypothetical protein JW384_04130 [Nitrosomonadaceae bacterium]|nr:hypothetical protein [Nitrosomonadaceae bacterium]
MNSVQTVPLELSYKGTRDYLHGTDMYNAIMECMGRLTPEPLHDKVKIVIHDFFRNQCDMLYAIGPERCMRPENARLEFYLGDNISGWLRETGRPVLTRRPYPEDEMVAKSRIEGQTIFAVPNMGEAFSPIEVLVALTKRLHLAVRAGASRWAFTRIDLQRPLQDGDSGRLQVELLQTLGNRLTKSAVRIGDVPLGQIYFSAIGP